MKKIASLFGILFLLTAFNSCMKSKDIFDGRTGMEFNYTPSYLTPTMVGIPVNGMATIAVNGKLINLNCITPGNNVGDALIVDAPRFPASWEWNNYQSQYQPNGSQWNTAGGFSKDFGKIYFVEIYANGSWYFHNGVSVTWGQQPNADGWRTSFEYPRTWIEKVNLPITGKVERLAPNRYIAVFP